MTTNAIDLKSTSPSIAQRVCRTLIPGYAARQDKTLINCFIDTLKKSSNPTLQAEGEGRLKNAIHLSEQFLRERLGSKINDASIPPGFAKLERYLFAARKRLNYFDSANSESTLKFFLHLHSGELFTRWNKLSFPEKAFYTSPDLVDFIFHAHLHRFIRHPDYQHTIEMQNGEPYLKMNGQMTAWSEISQRIFIDEDERLYSKGEQGEKVYWMYLNEGLTQWDRHNFQKPRHYKVLQTPPRTCQVQIVTSQLPKERWGLFDRPLKGTHHTHMRIITREGFSAAHPELGMQDGAVYSIGYGGRWNDVTMAQPLRTIAGKFYNPDSLEFFKQDLHVTTIDNVTDDQVKKMVEIIDRKIQEKHPFHILTSNCCTPVTETLREAGVVDLKSEIRLDHLIYKIALPKMLRNGLEAFGRAIAKILPDPLIRGVSRIGFILFSLTISPLLLILGAGRVKSGHEPSSKIKAMFSKLGDFFDPSRFTINLTLNVTKWQKKQPSTTYVKQN